MENMNIGDYVKDRRLGSVEDKYASFHGDGCDDGVLVLPGDDGGFWTQRTYTDPEDGEIKHTIGESYPTAAGALEAAIGDVQWAAEVTQKA